MIYFLKSRFTLLTGAKKRMEVFALHQRLPFVSNSQVAIVMKAHMLSLSSHKWKLENQVLWCIHLL